MKTFRYLRRLYEEELEVLGRAKQQRLAEGNYEDAGILAGTISRLKTEIQKMDAVPEAARSPPD